MTLRQDRQAIKTLTAMGLVFALGLTPAAAADFKIDGLKLDFGKFSLSFPHIEVKGSPLEREQFMALFNAASPESGAARMARISADEISAPELVIEQQFGPQRQSTVYRDVKLSAIREGLIGRGESAGGTIALTGGAAGDGKGTIKRLGFEGLDIRRITRVFAERAEAGKEEPFQPVLKRYEMEGYDLDLAKAGTVSFGRATGRDFAMKLGPRAMNEIFSDFVAAADEDARRQQGGDGDKEKSEARKENERKLLGGSLALLEQFEYGSGEMRDMRLRLAEPGKGGGKPSTVEMTLDRLAFGADTPAKSGYLIENISFSAEDGKAKGEIGSISHAGFSYADSLKAVREVLAQPDKPLDSVDFRRLIPTFGTLTMTGLKIEAPDPAAARRTGAAQAQPIKVGLGNFQVAVGEQLNGIPTSLVLTLDNLTVPIIDQPGNASLHDFIAMGYKAIDASAKLDLAWDQARNEIAIRSLTLGGAEMAKLEASAVLGNATKDLFAGDLALAQVAALGLTAQKIQAKLQNLGIAEKLIANEARKAKRKPEEMRRDFAMMANLGLAAILGPSDGAKTLAAAISRFVAQPGTLSVAAMAKSQSGLGLADVLTMTEPTEIFDKISVDASAQ